MAPDFSNKTNVISHRLYEGVSHALELCCDNAENTDTSVALIALFVMKKENSS
jgi:hypothetical protein